MFIEQRMCLNLPTQTNVCSLAWVLKCGFSFFSLSGLKFFLHSGDTWFAKWNTSIIFSTLDQDKSSGGGSGRGLCATLSLAKLHMLLYANVTWGMCWELFSRANNHCSTIETLEMGIQTYIKREPRLNSQSKTNFQRVHENKTLRKYSLSTLGTSEKLFTNTWWFTYTVAAKCQYALHHEPQTGGP